MVLEWAGVLYDYDFLSKLQEKCTELCIPLNKVFMDLTKSIDTINHYALWRILAMADMTDKSTKLTKVRGHLTFVNLRLLLHAFKDFEAGVSLRFRTFGKMFNLRRFNTKYKNLPIQELLYADYADILAYPGIFATLNGSLLCWLWCFWPEEVMFTPPPPALTILGKNTRLEFVETFPYLGSTILKDSALDVNIFSCIQKASVTFGKVEFN